MSALSSEKSKYLKSSECPIRIILDRIGEKWSILILLILKDNEVMRFSEIDKMIGDISQKMLSQTLKSLEYDGLIQKKIYPIVPPKVEYRLTELGEDLYPYISNLSDWAHKNLNTILKNRQKNLELKSHNN